MPVLIRLARLPCGGLLMYTGHHDADETPRLGEEPFRLAFDQAPIGMALVGLDWRVQQVNRALCATLGYDEDELLSRAFVDLIDPDDVARDVAFAERLVQGEIPRYTREHRFRTKDGRAVWLDLTALIIRGRQGEARCGLALVEPLTDRRQAEEALRKSEERYRSFVANSSEGIWRFEAEQPIDTALPVDEQITLFYKYGYLAECNDTMARMYGFLRAEEIIGKPLGDLLLASDPVNIASARAFISHHYRLTDVESVEVDRDGGQRYFLNNVIGIVEHGFLLRAWGTQRDITARKRADEALMDSRQQLRALAARLQSLREQERADIAREIHDVLGQGLTGVKLDLSWLSKRLPDADDAGVRAAMAARFTAAIQFLDETLSAVKHLSAALRPRLLETFGLSAAVEWQCLEFERRTGIACACRLPDDVPLTLERSMALFRILQETLTNVARHAHATSVQVTLVRDGGDVRLRVRDDGNGVTDAEIAAPGSLGILGMRERALLFGGDVVVQGTPGQGTLVTARIPLDHSDPR
jgi:PAS domain S-box-containing protein